MSAAVNFVLSERSLDDATALVSLEGDTSPAAARALGQHLASVADRRRQLVIVDMSGVTFVDSSVVEALAAGARGAKSTGTRVVVVEPIDPDIARPLSLGRLDGAAELVGTLREAADRSGVAPAAVQPPAPAPSPQQVPVRPRRKVVGRRARDQEILRELGQLRRTVLELKKVAGPVSVGPVEGEDAIEVEALRMELEEARAAAERMEEEAEQAHARIQALERELAATRGEADRMEEEAEQAHAKIQALEEEIALTHPRLRTLEDEADRMEDETEQAHARIHALEAEAAELRAQLEQARADAALATAEREQHAAAEQQRLRADEDRRRAEAEEAQRRAEEARLAAEREPAAADAEAPLRAEDDERRRADEAPRGPRPRVPVWADPTPIDLNTADLDDLMQLPGIGRRPAERILEFRAERGGFRSVDDLFAISEIPRDRLARIRSYVRV